MIKCVIFAHDAVELLDVTSTVRGRSTFFEKIDSGADTASKCAHLLVIDKGTERNTEKRKKMKKEKSCRKSSNREQEKSKRVIERVEHADKATEVWPACDRLV